MKILVTGGMGFTGSMLVKRLCQDGHQVVALDCRDNGRAEMLRQAGAQVVIGSVTEPRVVEEAIQGVQVVHHLAAAFREMNVPNRYYQEVNVGGTRNVLEAAWRHQVRKVIYCSTCGVHGDVSEPPANEEAPINAADYYQQTKYEAEPLVASYAERGMRTVILRPAAIYGPGDPERFAMLFKRVAKGRFPMFGSGRTLYHPLYVDNLIDAHLLAMAPEKGDGQAYLIADQEYLTIEELVQRIAQAMQVQVRIVHYPIAPLIVAGHLMEKTCRPLRLSPPIFPRRVDWFRQNRAFDIGKAKRELGYQPKIGLDEGLLRTAKWCRAEGIL
jgi:2-alkyl-3-oxoalkanoate reductase